MEFSSESITQIQILPKSPKSSKWLVGQQSKNTGSVKSVPQRRIEIFDRVNEKFWPK